MSRGAACELAAELSCALTWRGDFAPDRAGDTRLSPEVVATATLAPDITRAEYLAKSERYTRLEERYIGRVLGRALAGSPLLTLKPVSA
jgi:hypothetical protein